MNAVEVAQYGAFTSPITEKPVESSRGPAKGKQSETGSFFARGRYGDETDETQKQHSVQRESQITLFVRDYLG